ncbi:MAG TPA: hypothetical protein VFV23_13550 [Verrucomicrobiae bacterium]|nr:hypothetical protein [Verrucomicrobiae bacterium]
MEAIWQQIDAVDGSRLSKNYSVMAKLDRMENRTETVSEPSDGNFWSDWINDRTTETISEKEEHNIWTRAIHAALLAAETSK